MATFFTHRQSVSRQYPASKILRKELQNSRDLITDKSGVVVHLDEVPILLPQEDKNFKNLVRENDSLRRYLEKSKDREEAIAVTSLKRLRTQEDKYAKLSKMFHKKRKDCNRMAQHLWEASMALAPAALASEASQSLSGIENLELVNMTAASSSNINSATVSGKKCSCAIKKFQQNGLGSKRRADYRERRDKFKLFDKSTKELHCTNCYYPL